MALVLAAIAFGICAGIASGLLGIGGGTVMVPFLVLAAGLTQQEANATSLLALVPTAIVGTWTLQRRGVADIKGSAVLGTLGIAGSVAGSLIALSIPSGALRVIFAVFLATVGIGMLRDARRLRAQSASG